MSQIKAKVILRSGATRGLENHVVTFELEYPRFIHAEFMTHRVFSRNAASSRAIPVKTMIKQVRQNPAMPIHWGQNQSGMQAAGQLKGIKLWAAKKLWRGAGKTAATFALWMQKLGLHKQVANRVLEPFQLMKVVMTTTEMDNFIALRLHKDAQPEIQELARVMTVALEEGDYEYKTLEDGEWHLPYVGHVGPEGKEDLSLEDCKKLSASLCAQVSYRKADQSFDKALEIFDKLVNMRPVHASPFEHQCTPMPYEPKEGVTHRTTEYSSAQDMLLEGDFWSGNLREFLQWRQVIEGQLK